MDCRCGHSFCWLCLQPLSERCGCPQFGGRRTAAAKARLLSPGWRRAVLLSAEAASLRVLFAALCYGAALHRAEEIFSLACALGHAALAAPFGTKLLCAQALAGLVQLGISRGCLRVMPRRIWQHVAMRQVDLCCGGAGTHVILYALRALERGGLLPPHPPGSSFPMRLVHHATSMLLLGHRARRPGTRQPTQEHADARVRLHASVRDHAAVRNVDRPYHDHRPFAYRSNFSGYILSRRCRAALPALAAGAFALEVLLPSLTPYLIFAFLRAFKLVLLVPLSGATALLVRLAELAEPWRPADPYADAAPLPTPLSSTIYALAHYLWLPSLGAFVMGAVSAIALLAFLGGLCFLANVAATISLLSTLRECGVRRRVSARLHADPEAELEELHDDGELGYSVEDLRLDVVRVLLDARTLLFYMHVVLEAERFSSELWADLDTHLGASGVFDKVWLVGTIPNVLGYLHGMRLPTTAVCLNALIAHLEPVTLSWCQQWTVCARVAPDNLREPAMPPSFAHASAARPPTRERHPPAHSPRATFGSLAWRAQGRHFRPTVELLSHGFELLRLYTYLLLVLPVTSLMCIHSLLPALAAEWAASGAPLAYVPTRDTLLQIALRALMAIDGASIVYALASFRVPKPRAARLAASSFALLLPFVLATKTFPSFGTAHRAVLCAAIPPFAALMAMLAPFMHPRVGAPKPPAAAAAAGPGAPPPARYDDDDDDDDEPASEYDDDEWE